MWFIYPSGEHVTPGVSNEARVTIIIYSYMVLHFEESVGNIVNGDILWLSNEKMADPSFTTLNGDVVTHIEVT